MLHTSLDIDTASDDTLHSHGFSPSQGCKSNRISSAVNVNLSPYVDKRLRIKGVKSLIMVKIAEINFNSSSVLNFSYDKCVHCGREVSLTLVSYTHLLLL